MFCFNGKRKAENGKRKTEPTPNREQRVLAHYALQEGGKALEEGLKRTQ